MIFFYFIKHDIFLFHYFFLLLLIFLIFYSRILRPKYLCFSFYISVLFRKLKFALENIFLNYSVFVKKKYLESVNEQRERGAERENG